MFFFVGIVGDLLSYYCGVVFFMKDCDNDNYFISCFIYYKGVVWWFNFCVRVFLNGIYYYGNYFFGFVYFGINWYKWRGYDYLVKRFEMKIRLNDF